MGKCSLQCRCGPRLADSPPTGYPSSSSSWGEVFAAGHSETTLSLSQTPPKFPFSGQQQVDYLLAVAFLPRAGAGLQAAPACGTLTRRSCKAFTTSSQLLQHLFLHSRQMPFCSAHFHRSVTAMTILHPRHGHSPLCALSLPLLSLSNATSAASLASPIHTHDFAFSVEGPVSLLVHSYLIVTFNCL